MNEQLASQEHRTLHKVRSFQRLIYPLMRFVFVVQLPSYLLGKLLLVVLSQSEGSASLHKTLILIREEFFSLCKNLNFTGTFWKISLKLT